MPCFLELPLGRVSGMIRFTSCHRYSPFWTKPANGTTEAEVQPGTLWLLAQTDAGRCTMVKNANGSYDIYFGPNAPQGKEGNWVQTVPGKGWFVILRIYGPLEPWFHKTWQPAL